MTGILFAAWAFAVPPLLTLGMRRMTRLPVRSKWFFIQWASGGLCGALGYLIGGSRVNAAASAASALLALVLWWHSRRKRRKRSLRQLGSKARARLAAMARNMPRPGPVLRPAPQGA